MRHLLGPALLISLALPACDRERNGENGGTATEGAIAAVPVALTTADTGATLNPPASIDMEQQHHSMLMIQRGYDALLRSLNDGDKASVAKHVQGMVPYVDRIPVFMIHVPDVTPDSMIVLARKLKGQLLRVEQLAKADSVSDAREVATSTVITCGQCHSIYQAPHP